MRNLFLVGFLIPLLLQCSGLQKSDTARLDSIPDIKTVSTSLSSQEGYLDSNSPVSVKFNFESEIDLDREDRSLLKLRLNHWIQESKVVRLVEKGQSFDLNITLKQDSGSETQRVIKAELIDNRSGRSYPELIGYLEVNRSPSGKVDYAPGLKVVPEIRKEQYTLTESYAKQLKEWLARAGKGKLIVQSSRPAKVLVRETLGLKELGQTPLEVDVFEGQYELIAMRRGQEPVKNIVEVRAAADGRWLVTWPDDAEVTSIVIHSEPSGLRLALDNIVVGSTPSAVVGAQSGEVSLELSERDPETSDYIVKAADRLNVVPDHTFERAYLINYLEDFLDPFRSPFWQAASTAGPVSMARQGKHLQWSLLGNQDNEETHAGLLSAPVSPENSQFDFLINSRHPTTVVFLSDADRLQFTIDPDGVGATLHRGQSNPSIAYKSVSDRPVQRRLHLHIEQKEDGTFELNSHIDGQPLLQGPIRPGNGFRIGILSKAGVLGVQELRVLSQESQPGSFSRWISDVEFFFDRLSGSESTFKE